jgi:hypothetical protein
MVGLFVQCRVMSSSVPAGCAVDVERATSRDPLIGIRRNVPWTLVLFSREEASPLSHAKV